MAGPRGNPLTFPGSLLTLETIMMTRQHAFTQDNPTNSGDDNPPAPSRVF